MFKFKKTIRYGSTSFDDKLTSAKKSMFRLIFAMAMILKITPKKLAKFFDEQKMDEYAQKFHDELLLANKKEMEKLKKDFEKELKVKQAKKSKKTTTRKK